MIYSLILRRSLVWILKLSTFIINIIFIVKFLIFIVEFVEELLELELVSLSSTRVFGRGLHLSLRRKNRSISSGYLNV